MLVSNDRARAIHAAIYFIEHTANCQKTKVLKLLYLADVEHYRQTGRTITGMAYEAWEQGPVALDAWNGLTKRAAGWREAIGVACDPNGHGQGEPTYTLTPIASFDPDLFSPRELELLAKVAEEHWGDTATKLSNLCHHQEPWCAAWQQAWTGDDNRLDEDLFLVGLPDAVEVRAAAQEHRDFVVR